VDDPRAGGALPPLARSEKLAVAGFCLLGAIHARLLPGAPIADDAFITFRYARHLAAGLGFVWNPGESPVEGFTSPLHLLLLSLADRLGLDLLRASLVLGIVAVVAAVAATGALAREVTGGRSGSTALGALLAAIATPLSWWAKCGLETTLAAAILPLAMAVWAGERRTAGGGGAKSSLLFLLALLARPESAVAILLAVAFDLASATGRTGFSSALRDTIRRWSPLVVGIVVVEGARLGIFGELLPNTFHAKEPAGLDALAAGATDVAKSLRGLGGVGLLLAAASPLLLRSVSAAPLLVALGSTALFALHVVRVGGDYLGTGRYLVPVLPALLAAMVAGAVGAFDLLRDFSRRRRTLVATLAGAALVLPLLSGSVRALARDRVDPLHVGALEGVSTYDSDFASIGRALRRAVPPSQKVGVIAAGATSFYSERPVLDLLGLNDRRIARIPFDRRPRRWSPGHMKGNAAEVLARSPEYLVLEIHSTPSPGAAVSEEHLRAYPFVSDLLASTDFRVAYQLVPLEVSSGRWISLWRRRGLSADSSR
jgi:hypothetical protein